MAGNRKQTHNSEISQWERSFTMKTNMDICANGKMQAGRLLPLPEGQWLPDSEHISSVATKRQHKMRKNVFLQKSNGIVSGKNN